MANSFYPSQIGFIPTGVASPNNTSTIYLGRNVDVAWEAVGFGAQGRPDYLETININLTKIDGATQTRLGTISMNVSDIQDIIDGNSNAQAAALTLSLREVAVCDNGTARAMIILASDPYDTP